MIVTFEGGEGTGKTTCASLFCEYLTGRGLPWVSLREPGGSVLSEGIRSLFLRHEMSPMVELLLLLASRRRNVEEIVDPALNEGRIVVIDRFVDSTIVYQGVMGGLGVAFVRALMEQTGTWLEPDMTFVLDAPVETALARISPGDRFERMDEEYHRCVRKAFLDLACASRHRVVDASAPLADVMGCVIDAFRSGSGAVLA